MPADQHMVHEPRVYLSVCLILTFFSCLFPCLTDPIDMKEIIPSQTSEHLQENIRTIVQSLIKSKFQNKIIIILRSLQFFSLSFSLTHTELK